MNTNRITPVNNNDDDDENHYDHEGNTHQHQPPFQAHMSTTTNNPLLPTSTTASRSSSSSYSSTVPRHSVTPVVKFTPKRESIVGSGGGSYTMPRLSNVGANHPPPARLAPLSTPPTSTSFNSHQLAPLELKKSLQQPGEGGGGGGGDGGGLSPSASPSHSSAAADVDNNVGANSPNSLNINTTNAELPGTSLLPSIKKQNVSAPTPVEASPLVSTSSSTSSAKNLLPAQTSTTYNNFNATNIGSTTLDVIISTSHSPTANMPIDPVTPSGPLPPGYIDLTPFTTKNPNSVLNTLPNNGLSSSATSTADFEINPKGNIKTFDSLLDRDPDEVWRFIEVHLRKKPGLVIRVQGVIPAGSSSGGGGGEYRDLDKVEFSVDLDVSGLIKPAWTRIVAVSGGVGGGGVDTSTGGTDEGGVKKEGEDKQNQNMDTSSPPTLISLLQPIHSAIKSYTDSHASMKKLVVKKQIHWDFTALSSSLKSSLRAAGYSHDVRVQWIFSSDKISVHASSAKHARWLFCCLWLLLAPMYCCIQRRLGVKLVAEYEVDKRVDEFVAANQNAVVEAWKAHTVGRKQLAN